MRAGRARSQGREKEQGVKGEKRAGSQGGKKRERVDQELFSDGIQVGDVA